MSLAGRALGERARCRELRVARSDIGFSFVHYVAASATTPRCVVCVRGCDGSGWRAPMGQLSWGKGTCTTGPRRAAPSPTRPSTVPDSTTPHPTQRAPHRQPCSTMKSTPSAVCGMSTQGTRNKQMKRGPGDGAPEQLLRSGGMGEEGPGRAGERHMRVAGGVGGGSRAPRALRGWVAPSRT